MHKWIYLIICSFFLPPVLLPVPSFLNKKYYRRFLILEGCKNIEKNDLIQTCVLFYYIFGFFPPSEAQVFCKHALFHSSELW